MQVRQAVLEFLIAKHSLRFRTKQWYEMILERFAEWCEKQGIELEQVKAAAVRRYLSEIDVHSTHTLHGYTQVIKSFLLWCALEEEYEDLVTEKTVKRIEQTRLEKKAITIFTTTEIKTLFKACETRVDASLCARDKAILSLLLDCGLRVSEIAYDGERPNEMTGLRMGYVFLKPKDSYLVVTGKGGKEREVGMGDKARLALKRYITQYRGNSTSPFVFLSRRGDPLAARSVEEVTYWLAEAAGVTECYPHKFRHTFACMYLLNGGDIFKLSIIMGHSDVKVTQLYLRAITAMQARKGLSVLDSLQ